MTVFLHQESRREAWLLWQCVFQALVRTPPAGFYIDFCIWYGKILKAILFVYVSFIEGRERIKEIRNRKEAARIEVLRVRTRIEGREKKEE